MIRDPSDGTVREKSGGAETRSASASGSISSTAYVEKPPAPASGLPTDKIDAKELARLEKARLWVRDYIHRNPVQSTESEDDST